MRARRRQAGQSLTEFALVTPVLLFLLLGTLESALLVFTVGTARFAAAEGAQVDSDLGNATNADTMAVQTIRTGPFGQTSLGTVQHIDVYRLTQQGNGTLAVDNAAYNSYRLDGTSISITWAPATRNVRNGVSDFLGLTIYYQYQWRSGTLLGVAPLSLTQTAYVRLEPQSY